MHQLLQSFVSNFIHPDVIKYTSIQLSNDELSIGTSTHLLWYGEFENLVGTTRHLLMVLFKSLYIFFSR